jgi:hypothetical protein
MKKFRSKTGIGIVLFIVFILGGSSVFMTFYKAWPGIAINLALGGFIFYIFRSTYYILDGQDLVIKSGFSKGLRINVQRITKIVETNNPLSSPATSLDRIAIYYTAGPTVMISPAGKMDFIRHLVEINPRIEVILKRPKHI